MVKISLTLYTNEFFASVLKSPIQIWMLSVNNSVISCLMGTFNWAQSSSLELESTIHENAFYRMYCKIKLCSDIRLGKHQFICSLRLLFSKWLKWKLHVALKAGPPGICSCWHSYLHELGIIKLLSVCSDFDKAWGELIIFKGAQHKIFLLSFFVPNPSLCKTG